MANIGFTVNTEELPDAQDFSPVPAGRYTVMIVNSKLQPTNKTKEVLNGADYETFLKTNPKASGFLNIEMDIQDNGQEGRKLFHNFNLVNDSEKAVEIAFGQLKQLLSGLGMKQWSGKSEDLHNKRFAVEVSVETGKDYVKDGQNVAGKPQSVIKKFTAAGGVAQAATTQTAATGTTGATPPWKR